MIYATKLMVVPFVNRLEDPTEKYLNNLDEELMRFCCQSKA
jgi:hypothetical protein